MQSWPALKLEKHITIELPPSYILDLTVPRDSPQYVAWTADTF